MPGHNQKKSNRKKYHGGEPPHAEAGISDLRVETDNSLEKDISSERNNGQSVNHAASSDEAASASSTPRFPSGPVSREGSISPRSMSPHISGLRISAAAVNGMICVVSRNWLPRFHELLPFLSLKFPGGKE